MLKEEFSDDNNEEENDKSESLTVLMRNSNANISKISIEDHNLSDNEDLAKEFPEEINGKKLKIDYDNLLNEHIKALETIKELKRKLVQKYEEKNFLKNPPPTKNNNITFQEQKENLKSFSSTSIQNNLVSAKKKI